MYSRTKFLEFDVFRCFPMDRPVCSYSYDFEYLDGLYDEISLNSPYSGFVGFGRRCANEMAWFKIIIGDEKLDYLNVFFESIGLRDCVICEDKKRLDTGVKSEYDEKIILGGDSRITCFGDDNFHVNLHEDAHGMVNYVEFFNLVSIIANCPKRSTKSVLKLIRW